MSTVQRPLDMGIIVGESMVSSEVWTCFCLWKPGIRLRPSCFHTSYSLTAVYCGTVMFVLWFLSANADWRTPVSLLPFLLPFTDILLLPFCSLTHSIKYRRDVCFSQSLTALVSALMGRLWCRPPDTSFLSILTQIGMALFSSSWVILWVDPNRRWFCFCKKTFSASVMVASVHVKKYSSQKRQFFKVHNKTVFNKKQKP